MIYRNRKPTRRSGAALMEMALAFLVMLPLFALAVDFCRIFFVYSALASAARAGAIYEADPTSVVRAQSKFTSATDAATQDWPENLPALAISTVSITDESGTTFVTVTATTTFTMAAGYTGLPASFDLTRAVKVRQSKPLPRFT